MVTLWEMLPGAGWWWSLGPHPAVSLTGFMPDLSLPICRMGRSQL